MRNVATKLNNDLINLGMMYLLELHQWFLEILDDTNRPNHRSKRSLPVFVLNAHVLECGCSRLIEYTAQLLRPIFRSSNDFFFFLSNDL